MARITNENGLVIGKKPLIDEREMESETFGEIISQNPGVLLKWSNYFFLILFLVIIGGLFVVKYPNRISAVGKLRSINSPIPVISHLNTTIFQLWVEEGNYVLEGQILGYFESLAKHSDVLALSTEVEIIKALMENQKVEDVDESLLNKNHNLGELQIAFDDFMKGFSHFKFYSKSGLFSQKMALLKEDYQFLIQMNNYLVEEKELLLKDVKLTEKSLELSELMGSERFISELDLNNERSKALSKQLSLPRINYQISSNQRAINERFREFIEMENVLNNQYQNFHQSINTLKSQIDDWKKKYLITAPVSGKVSFSSFIQENLNVYPEQILFYVIPESTEYYVEALIPQLNFGKVTVGQDVILKFQSYPYEVDGSVRGKILAISDLVSEDSRFLARIDLINGLNSTNYKIFEFREGLSVQIEIITENSNLFVKLFQ